MTTSDATPRTLHELAAQFGIEAPRRDVEITGLNTIEAAGPTELTFLSNERYATKLKESAAGAALVPADFEGELPMPALRTAQPRIVFAKLMSAFHPRAQRPAGRHPTAIVPESCTIGDDVSIGAYVVLGENVTLGDRCVLHPHAVLYDDVVIGADCEIHGHVSLREGVVLGDRVIVHNGSVIGADGFGFEPDADGSLFKIPQVGSVRIADDVEIQANVCVDRSALGDTLVGEGTKIDNFAQIAHGCTIGKHSVICGQVGLAGSTKIGNHVMLGGGTGSAGHVEVGDGVQAAARSGIMMDLEPGAKVGGVPAIPIKDALRAVLYAPQVPSIARRLKKMERRVEALEEAENADA